jgi:hypothetical protein
VILIKKIAQFLGRRMYKMKKSQFGFGVMCVLVLVLVALVLSTIKPRDIVSNKPINHYCIIDTLVVNDTKKVSIWANTKTGENFSCVNDNKTQLASMVRADGRPLYTSVESEEERLVLAEVQQTKDGDLYIVLDSLTGVRYEWPGYASCMKPETRN